MDEQDKVNLEKLRRMIKDSGNELINLVEIGDEILMRYVRRSPLNLQTSLKLLVNGFEARFSAPFAVIIERGFPSAVRHVFDKQIFGILKQRDQLGRKVVWFRLNRWDPNELQENDLFIAICLVAWELLASKSTQLKGIVGVLDVSECTLAHVLKLAKMKLHIKLFMQCGPFRSGGGHILFAPMTFNIGYFILKSLFPRKLRKAIHVHHGKKSLHEYIPANTLPNFFGGLLTEREATDYTIIESLLEKDKYYKGLIELGRKEFCDRFPKEERRAGEVYSH